MKKQGNIVVLFLALCLALVSCAPDGGANGDVYQPIGLRKLSAGEMIERITSRRMTKPEKIWDAQGNELTVEQMMQFDQKEYFHDMFVNGDGELKGVVIRKATRADKEVMKRIEEATQDLQTVIE